MQSVHTFLGSGVLYGTYDHRTETADRSVRAEGTYRFSQKPRTTTAGLENFPMAQTDSGNGEKVRPRRFSLVRFPPPKLI